MSLKRPDYSTKVCLEILMQLEKLLLFFSIKIRNDEISQPGQAKHESAPKGQAEVAPFQFDFNLINFCPLIASLSEIEDINVKICSWDFRQRESEKGFKVKFKSFLI